MTPSAAAPCSTAASEKFARQLTGIDLASDLGRRRCVAELRTRFVTTVIVTLGEAGLVADDGTGFWHLPAYPANPVDTTAAGDIFHGALCYFMMNSVSWREALAHAAEVAAYSCRFFGTRAWMEGWLTRDDGSPKSE
jgi:sugar/nucleoside kinase (ribokinase family)